MIINHLIPWSKVKNWRCKMCGKCCFYSRIPLSFEDYATIVSKYGEVYVVQDQNLFVLKHKKNGSCVFLRMKEGKYTCKIQEDKPLVCKLFPFRVYLYPKFKDNSEFKYKNKSYYVYLDLSCSGIKLGAPSEELISKVLPEVIEIYERKLIFQKYSTSYLSHSNNLNFPNLKILYSAQGL
ncbi:MAG: YkgJ family cysteine cluster protein [Thermoproteota archaeon]|nr:YkgJ family cysteine cluster protein [Candidatus Brockarchaeota archaeon]